MAKVLTKGEKMSELDACLRQVILGAESTGDCKLNADIPFFTVPNKTRSQANNALSILKSTTPSNSKLATEASVVSKPAGFFTTPTTEFPLQPKECWTSVSKKPKIKDKSQGFTMPRLPSAWFRFREDSEFKNLIQDSRISKSRASLVFLAGFLSGCLSVLLAMMIVIGIASSGMRDPDDPAAFTNTRPVTTVLPEQDSKIGRIPAVDRNAPNAEGRVGQDSEGPGAGNHPQNISGIFVTKMTPAQTARTTQNPTTAGYVTTNSSKMMDSDETHGATNIVWTSRKETSGSDSITDQNSAFRSEQMATTESTWGTQNTVASTTYDQQYISAKPDSVTATKAPTPQEEHSSTGMSQSELSTENPAKQSTTKSSWQHQSVSIISGILSGRKPKVNGSRNSNSTGVWEDNLNRWGKDNSKPTTTSSAQIEQPEAETSGNRRTSRNIGISSEKESDREAEDKELLETTTVSQIPIRVPKKKKSWLTRFLLAVKHTLKKINPF